jgi:hypothetical protein
VTTLSAIEPQASDVTLFPTAADVSGATVIVRLRSLATDAEE